MADTLTMEIINSEQYKRANIRFSGIPAEEVRTELKNEGWLYSRNHNVWYPRNIAAENSTNFANHIKMTYFPEPQREEVHIITEASEKNELLSMVQNGSTLKEILAKLSDMYGENAVSEAFQESKEKLEQTQSKETSEEQNTSEERKSELALHNKVTGEFFLFQENSEGNWDYTAYDREFSEIDGGILAKNEPDGIRTIQDAAETMTQEFFPESDFSNWEEVNYEDVENSIDFKDYDEMISMAEQERENRLDEEDFDDEYTDDSIEYDDSDDYDDNEPEYSSRSEVTEPLNREKSEEEIKGEAKRKLNDIIDHSLLWVTQAQAIRGDDVQTKQERYDKYTKPTVDEILAEIENGNKEVIARIEAFSTDKANHQLSQSWNTAEEAYERDVREELIPELYEAVQDRIRSEYEASGTPYIVLKSSESTLFPSEGKIYSVKEFNNLLTGQDSEWYNGRENLVKKYGSMNAFLKANADGKVLPEEKEVHLGYAKTDFEICNVADPNNPGNTLSYRPIQYDIGDGNGSIFDYIRKTCAHDDIIQAMNELENELYFSDISELQKPDIENIFAESSLELKAALQEPTATLFSTMKEYKKLPVASDDYDILVQKNDHENIIDSALVRVQNTYEKAVNSAFDKIHKEFPFTNNNINSPLHRFAANEAKKMVIENLYLPTRESQKAMNASDFKTFSGYDWSAQNLIWKKMPATVNMSSYVTGLLSEKLQDRPISVDEHEEQTTPTEIFDTFATPIPEEVRTGMNEMRKEIEEEGRSFDINGERYTQKEIETLLEEDIQTVFRELVPEPYIEGVRLYKNPEKDGKISLLVQYSTNEAEGMWREDSLFDAIAEENLTFNGMTVDVNPITPEKSGTIDEYLDRLEKLEAASEEEAIEKQAEMIAEKENAAEQEETGNQSETEELPNRNILSFEPFGYEGAVVTIETDLRRGIPAYDIVGLADNRVKEAREVIKAAFKNSGFELPAERILQSLSPADLRKDGYIETLAMAASILNEQNNYKGEPVLVLGDLELSGKVRPVRSVHAAVSSAAAMGIRDIIVPEENVEEAREIPGARVIGVKSLSEVNEILSRNERFPENSTAVAPWQGRDVVFDEDRLSEIYDMNLDGYYDTARAIEIAIAGKHNILLEGAPGSGKTFLADNLIPALTPALTNEEAQSVTRIHSIAGLMRPTEALKKFPSFRMPHQTASIEGICGGGQRCSPGEISLAHNGILFLDEAAEFRSSVLQMLRVPVETGTITLSRAGRTTSYPANFQLVMATNPCPCGNYGNPDKICLCSSRSIEQYWKKFSDPLIDRIEIKQNVVKDESDRRKISVAEMKHHIENAIRIQRENPHYNSKLNPQEIAEKCQLNWECEEFINRQIERNDISPRGKANMLKVALTIANMDNRTEIALDDLREAAELSAPMFEKPHEFKRDQSEVKFGNFTFNSYYHSTNTRDLCHDVKQTENIAKRSEAISKMADYLAGQLKNVPVNTIKVPKNYAAYHHGDNLIAIEKTYDEAVISGRSEGFEREDLTIQPFEYKEQKEKLYLVPAPQHTGNAEYTLEIAKRIAQANPDCEVLDILKCEPHEPLYNQKKDGNRKPDLELYLDEKPSVPENAKIFLVDNVISTGQTFNTANELFDGKLIPLAYAASDFARFETENGKVIIKDTRTTDTSNDISVNSISTPEKNDTSNGLSEVVIDLSATKEPVQLTEDDIEICKMVIPPQQYKFTLELTQGEEGEFFKQKLKEIADTFRKINTDDEVRNEDGTHNVGFRYFLGNTEIYISQIYPDGIGFGFTILNGDLEMAEWGDSSIEEILDVPGIEMDYHVPEGMTIERMLHDRHPDYFPTPETATEVEATVTEAVATSEVNTETQSDTNQPNYHFYVKDMTEIETFAQFEPITNLTAEQAVTTLLEKENDASLVGIGIVIPGSSDHGTDFEGTGVAEFYKDGNHYIYSSIFLDEHHTIKDNSDYVSAVNDILIEFKRRGIEVSLPQTQNTEEKQAEKKEAIPEQKKKLTKEKSIREKFPNGLYQDDIEKHVSKARKDEISEEMRKRAQKSGYSMSYDLLMKYIDQYEKAVNENDWETIYGIDYDLTNINFHSECSLLSEYKFEKCREVVCEDFERPYTPPKEKQKTKGEMKSIREQCREILRKPDGEITEADKTILAQYEGGGGLDEKGRTNSAVLNEFYTPRNLVEKVWEIADHYAPNAASVLEPSSGPGRFADGRNNNSFTMYEKDEVSAQINRILHPAATVIAEPFQKQFFDEYERFKKIGYELPKYDLVIGNPPYGTYSDKYKGLGEGTDFDRYEEYFIEKGLESLKDENSLLAFVVPSGFLNTAWDKAKSLIAEKGEIIDAYRLPEGTFPTTEVGTDIIVMRPWTKYESEFEKEYGPDLYISIENHKRDNSKLLAWGEWFKQHPEKILGEVKTRTNRFGKEEEYVCVHNGKSVQDELNKITELISQAKTEIASTTEVHAEEKTKSIQPVESSETKSETNKNQSVIPIDEVRKVYANAYPSNAEHASEEAEKFIKAWKSKEFNGLIWGMCYAYPQTPALKALFEKTEGITLPEEHTKRLIVLSKYADYESVPPQFKFKNWTEAIRYDVAKGSSFENGKKRIFEFFRSNLSKKDRADFLKKEYGIGGYGGTGYDQNHDAKGIKLKVIIKDEEQSRLFSWSEVADTISFLMLNGEYYKPEKEQSETAKPTAAKSVSTGTKDASPTPQETSVPRNIPPSQGIMTAREFSHLYGKEFDELSYSVWSKADWEGHINTNKLSQAEADFIKSSEEYVEEKPGLWTHKVMFESGDIYKKIAQQKQLLSNALFNEDKEAAELHKKNISRLESARKPPVRLDDIHIALNSTLAEEFMITHRYDSGLEEKRNLSESFILWAQGETVESQKSRRSIDYSTARISREEMPENIYWYDIIDFIDNKKVIADKTSSWSYGKTEEEIKQLRRERKKEADEKRMARAETANRLFDRYMHEGLDEATRERFLDEYNRRFNSYVVPKYENLPLYIDGMSTYKGKTAFKLYDQQLKGVARLSAKGNGLLAYDVGVGKTATGIVANVNQIQTHRSKRPLIIVPNQVYSKWVTDIHQLFPKIQVNELFNFNDESIEKFRDKDDIHKLNIPLDSISVCTYEALKRITFTEQSCTGPLFADFANLLSADFDGNMKQNAETGEKIMAAIGTASCVNDSNYVFFERCGFDNITVDEAHNFKNLWTAPRPKNKGDANEYSGVPSGTPSKRAIKLFAMTQLTQRNNANRNVFLLTATPFTNSPVEVYSMLSYIGRERLVASGIYSLRDFMNQFAHTKLELGVNTKGEIDYKQVMKDWKELPALQNLLTEFIDKVDGEEAGIIRPKKFSHVKELDLSPLQKKIMAREEERMTTVTENSGAILEAMNNMRVALVSPALLNKYKYDGLELPGLENLVESSPKLKFVCDAIVDMNKIHPDKGQFMYMPLGKEGHGIVKDYLIEHGIPKSSIEIINGETNNTPEKKEKITTAFNDPKSRLKIIIGGKNTAEGIDLNGNSFVMYNCSLGWNPSEPIQAIGRIWRQGNMQGHIHGVYPVMTDSIDSLLYQKHDEKRSRINDLWTYKGNMLNVEDINPEELKFDLIKDPAKRAKLILSEETKDLKAKLAKVKLKQESFDELLMKRKEVREKLESCQEEFKTHSEIKQNFLNKGERIPSYLYESLRDDKKNVETYTRQDDIIKEKLAGMNLHTEQEIQSHVSTLNKEKHDIEKEIKDAEKKLPKLLEELRMKLAEQKLTAHPIEQQRKELEASILGNLRPMADIIEEMKKSTGAAIEKADEPYMDEKGEYYLFNVDDFSGKISERTEPYDNGKLDDLAVTPSQIAGAKKEREAIIRPVLDGEKSGLWKAFEEFEQRGVFDIQGKSIDINDDGKISDAGWKQLQAAANIYRNKKFETFRYVLLNKNTGEIKDQMAVSSQMPNITVISTPKNDTLKQVISRAEKKNCLVAVMHNHPSGNVEPSIYDVRTTDALQKNMTRTDGKCLFAGHIILDHDKFSLYTPEKGWETVFVESGITDELMKKETPEWTENKLDTSESLVQLAKEINGGESWNDDYIPVVFTDASQKISGVQYYSRNFFYSPSDKIQKVFQDSAIESGALMAFPVVTDACLEKMNEEDRNRFTEAMKAHVEKNSFSDAAISDTTISQKFDIKPGKGFSENFSSNKQIDVKSTWKPEIDPTIFCEQKRKSKEEDIER